MHANHPEKPSARQEKMASHRTNRAFPELYGPNKPKRRPTVDEHKWKNVYLVQRYRQFSMD
jgi:hypothetical protein